MEVTMELKIGSLVRLKSGGPTMTIVDIPDNLEGMVVCAWIWNGEPKQATYPERALEDVSEDKDLEGAIIR
jgi:uncharacterized protein YodC (DUF2158 family)